MTKFGKSKIINQCDGFIQKFNNAGEKVMKDAEGPEVVAKMIYNSASDNNYQMMYAVGKRQRIKMKCTSEYLQSIGRWLELNSVDLY